MSCHWSILCTNWGSSIHSAHFLCTPYIILHIVISHCLCLGSFFLQRALVFMANYQRPSLPPLYSFDAHPVSSNHPISLLIFYYISCSISSSGIIPLHDYGLWFGNDDECDDKWNQQGSMPAMYSAHMQILHFNTACSNWNNDSGSLPTRLIISGKLQDGKLQPYTIYWHTPQGETPNLASQKWNKYSGFPFLMSSTPNIVAKSVSHSWI